MKFKMNELKRVVKSLNEIKISIGARFGSGITHFIQTVSSKKANDSILLKRDNLEKLSAELHGLELRHGINLGQTIYHFMHSFHKN